MSKSSERKKKSLRKRPTIYDLAKLTGFSRGSISRAFNNSVHINPSTREKILKVANEIGYHPHTGARLIKTGRTNRWGILLPNLSNPYYAKLFEAFDSEARKRDTFVQLGLYHYDKKVAETLVTSWAAGEVDGLVSDTGVNWGEIYVRLRKQGLPMVFLHARPSADYDLVNIDRSSGTRHALHSLKLLGHRKVFYMGIHTANERITGSYQLWRSWFEENGEGDPEEYSCFVPNESGGGGQGWKEIVSRGIHPTAVLAYNDIIACGLIQSARNDGKRVPEDLSVIGSDDIDEGWRLGLTTMSGDLRLAASIALRQLEERRSGDTRPPVVHRVEAEFVMRNTVGPARR